MTPTNPPKSSPDELLPCPCGAGAHTFGSSRLDGMITAIIECADVCGFRVEKWMFLPRNEHSPDDFVQLTKDVWLLAKNAWNTRAAQPQREAGEEVKVKFTMVEDKLKFDIKNCAHLSYDGKKCYKCGYVIPATTSEATPTALGVEGAFDSTDELINRLAEQVVIDVRGSWDVPAFGVCVQEVKSRIKAALTHPREQQREDEGDVGDFHNAFWEAFKTLPEPIRKKFSMEVGRKFANTFYNLFKKA